MALTNNEQLVLDEILNTKPEDMSADMQALKEELLKKQHEEQMTVISSSKCFEWDLKSGQVSTDIDNLRDWVLSTNPKNTEELQDRLFLAVYEETFLSDNANKAKDMEGIREFIRNCLPKLSSHLFFSQISNDCINKIDELERTQGKPKEESDLNKARISSQIYLSQKAMQYFIVNQFTKTKDFFMQFTFNKIECLLMIAKLSIALHKILDIDYLKDGTNPYLVLLANNMINEELSEQSELIADLAKATETHADKYLHIIKNFK